MAQAEPDVSRIPSGVILTKKGERHCAEHAIHAAEIAAKNDRARKSIGREIEELLRIRREAGDAASRLIDLLDLHELDPDLEDGGDAEQSLGWTAGEAAYGRAQNNAGEDHEPDLGWTAGINQSGRAWHGRPHAGDMWNAVPDGEAEHDGREADCDGEDGHDAEDCNVVMLGGSEARLRGRRDAGKAVRP